MSAALVLSNALPKSASTLLSRYTIDLVAAACPRTGQAALRGAVAAGRIGGSDSFVRDLDPATVADLRALAGAHGPVVVKCHAALTPALRDLVEGGAAVVTLAHRDPRDVLLSAADHHRDLPEEEGFWAFASLDAAIPQVAAWCAAAVPWARSGLAHVARYGDLVTDPCAVLAGVAAHLGLHLDAAAVRAVVDREAAARRPGVGNFNTGRRTRFRDELTDAQVARCTAALHDEIVALGYEP